MQPAGMANRDMGCMHVVVLRAVTGELVTSVRRGVRSKNRFRGKAGKEGGSMGRTREDPIEPYLELIHDEAERSSVWFVV